MKNAFIMAATCLVCALPLAAQDDTASPPAEVAVGEYVTEAGEPAAAASGHVVRVYQDSIPWFGENRHHATLLSLGKVLGTDYFIHPLTDLSLGIPADTSVVLIPSNGFGLPSATSNQNAPAAQASLASFLGSGGVVIVDMGDNDFAGGYRAPGSTGTPSYVFPSPCSDATLTLQAAGDDGVLGTADDHPLVKGPDGIANTADDLTNGNIDMSFSCAIAHGNLAQGITLPGDAVPLMTASFNSGEQPILAEYCFDNVGRVLLDTLTKEFVGQNPGGTGPSVFMRNLFSYAMSAEATCVIPVDIDIKFCSDPNGFNCKSQGVTPVTIFGTADLDIDDIDIASLRLCLEDLSQCTASGPKSWSVADRGSPGDVGAEQCAIDPVTGEELDWLTQDGFDDLDAAFRTQEVVEVIGCDGLEKGDTSPTLVLTGQTTDGTPITSIPIGDDGIDQLLIQKN